MPALERANVNAFFKVWGTSARNVYVVGQSGAVLHFDGNEWSELLVGASDDLISLWGTGKDNIVAVGGRNSGVVGTFDGQEWHSDTLPTYRASTASGFEPLAARHGRRSRRRDRHG